MSRHMIDIVDPDAVDFHPLYKSINGAAATNLSLVSEPSSPPTDHSPAATTALHQIPEPMLRFHGRSHTHEKEYFNSTDPNVADPSAINPQVTNSIFFRTLNQLCSFLAQFSKYFSQCFPLSSGLPTKLLLILCAISVLVVFQTGAVAKFFLSSSLNSSRAITALSTPGRQKSHQGISLAPPVGTKLPPGIESNFANVYDLPMELTDTAIYWHVPRSAGTTMKHILATCLGRVITTEIGGSDGHQMDERLQMIRLPHGVFLNVDTTTPSGLRHAKTMGLAQSKMADVIFTPYVPDAAVLFDSNHRGRFFTILREPVDRMISLYYYKRLATWEPNYNPAIKEQTLEDFTQSYGENWMVRALTGCMSGPLQLVHLNIAKEILRKKFLIGILDEKTESLRRFEEYFGWKFPSPVAQTCKNNMFYFEWHSGNPHPQLKDELVTKKIRTLNMWDVALYEYGKQLFQEQEHLFWISDAATN